VFGKPFEGVGPEPVEPGVEGMESGRVEPVDVSGAELLVGHEPASVQDLKMLRDCRAADWQPAGQLADGRRPIPKGRDDLAASSIA
jgi:hypothetical protein